MRTIRKGGLAVSLSLAMLAGCATSGTDGTTATTSDVGTALSRPVKDLNLTRDEIPPLLEQSVLHPYATPSPALCPVLDADIAAFDSVLGPDLDTIPRDANSMPRDAGWDLWSMAGDGLAGFIPFHGVVRYVTGAEAHARKLRLAILAGHVRRAYLKGIRIQLACVSLPRQSAAGAASD